MRWERSLTERASVFASSALLLHPKVAQLGPPYAHVADQLFEAASSIGANLEEGQVALSRRDMAAKYAIALREARECLHWLRILMRARVLLEDTRPMATEANEFVAMLTTAVKKLRARPA